MQDREKLIEIIKSYEETFTQLENKYRTHPHYPGGEWYLLEKLDFS